METITTLNSPEMETALVACGLMDGGVYDLAGVQPEHFHNRMLATVWRTIGKLRRAGDYVDPVTVLHALDAAGSGVTMGELDGILVSDANVTHWETYAARVLDYAHRREVLAIAQETARAAHLADGAYRDALTALRSRLDVAVRRLAGGKAAAEAAKTCWTVAELLATSFPEPRWAVPGIVPVGLTLLAGRPKVGKSWLALQIAQAVGAGGVVLEQAVAAGSVLYLALEDGPRRLKNRLLKQGTPSHADITFHTEWRRFTDGGLDDLQTALAAGGYSLIVVDTFTRALGRADPRDPADMTYFMGTLQELALAHDIAILVVDHHRKPLGFAENPIDDILGATAKSASADSAVGLFKEQGKAGAVLKVIGRDLEPQELALSWDAATCCWQLEGTVDEVSLRGRKGQVLDALRGAGDELTLTGIAEITGMDKRNLSPILNDLHADGKIQRLPKRGREIPYRLVEGV